MAQIEAKLEAMGLTLPAALQPPPGMKLPFTPVRVRGDRAYVSGHSPQNVDGSITMTGKLGVDFTVEQGYEAARLTALAMLGSIQRALGDLDRVAAWLKVLGMVNCASDFVQTPNVINGFSDLIIELWGADRGAHARSAVGMNSLPVGIPVEVEAEIEIEV